MRTWHAAGVLWLGAAALSCGERATEPSSAGIGGTYTYTFRDLTAGGPVSCSGTLTMPVTPQGSTFSGSYEGAVTCLSAVGPVSRSVRGRVVNGRVAGDSVFFDFDDGSWRNAGVLEAAPGGPSMRGIVRVTATATGSPVTLEGTFTCVRR